jgi:ADP-heptose:LPS heptosyltransferase
VSSRSTARIGRVEGFVRASTVVTFDDLSLPEITALASKATVFVGMIPASPIIAAAVNTPTVVIFGSSNRNHCGRGQMLRTRSFLRNFTVSLVAGRECKEFGEPRCILGVKREQVEAAIEKVLTEKHEGERLAPAIS